MHREWKKESQSAGKNPSTWLFYQKMKFSNTVPNQHDRGERTWFQVPASDSSVCRAVRDVVATKTRINPAPS
jgi:hypothetical protein